MTENFQNLSRDANQLIQEVLQAPNSMNSPYKSMPNTLKSNFWRLKTNKKILKAVRGKKYLIYGGKLLQMTEFFKN